MEDDKLGDYNWRLSLHIDTHDNDAINDELPQECPSSESSSISEIGVER